MSRVTNDKFSPLAQEFLDHFHADVLKEVHAAVETDPVVVVGMATNPHVGKVRKALDAEGIDYTYLGYGGYLSQWSKRLAIKMWSGWPTYPQVFVKGTLIGGNSRTCTALESGLFRELLEG
jgi:monothiol glutaredoxin